jgi:nucleotide-binding universal stress UspA family protein
VAGAFERLREQLDVPDGVTVESVALRGAPVPELLALIERTDADLVAVGSQSGALERGAPLRTTLGSVTRALVRVGRVSLLVAPAAAHHTARFTIDAPTS